MECSRDLNVASVALAGSTFASLILSKSQQRLERVCNIVRGPACEAHGIKRPKDEVSQQARIRLTRKNAGALRIRDKLRPSRNVCSPEFADNSTRRIIGKGGCKHGDRVVTQLMYRGGVSTDSSSESRGCIGMIWNRSQSRIEISERRKQPLFEHRLDQLVFRFEVEIDAAGLKTSRRRNRVDAGTSDAAARDLRRCGFKQPLACPIALGFLAGIDDWLNVLAHHRGPRSLKSSFPLN